jgi:hypothetical protein
MSRGARIKPHAIRLFYEISLYSLINAHLM